jgi:hypothetical protein
VSTIAPCRFEAPHQSPGTGKQAAHPLVIFLEQHDGIGRHRIPLSGWIIAGCSAVLDLIFPILTRSVLCGAGQPSATERGTDQGHDARERDQQPAAATRSRPAALYVPSCVYFRSSPSRPPHFASGTLGSSSSVARRVRRFSCLGIWVRPPYEGRQAKVAPQI